MYRFIQLYLCTLILFTKESININSKFITAFYVKHKFTLLQIT